MSLGDENKLDKIEDLKTKLFSQNYEMKVEHRDNFSHLKSVPVPDSWEDNMKEKIQYGENFFVKTPVFKNFFFFSLIFFILTALYASYVFFAGGNTVSNNNIDISITGNTFTAGGEELSLVVGIANRNSTALELVDLIVEYPKSSSGDLSGETDRIRESIGAIPAGSVKNENVKLVLFGEQGSVRPIKVSIEYRVEGSNAIFVKDKPYEVSITSTPINLSIEGPTSVSPNQDIVLDVKATLNATKPLSKILIKVDYPSGFQFASSKPAPSLGNNIWSLGDMAPGAERTISIVGKMIDASFGEEKNFRVWSGSQSVKDKSVIDVVFNSFLHTFTIKKPFIETQFFVNGAHQREYAVESKTMIHGEIHYTNNLDTKINNLIIKAKVSGNALNRKTINVEQGFYNSSSNTIVWDKNSIDKFKEINPGDAGVVNFSLSPSSLFSSPSGILVDPSIVVQVDISGEQSVSGFNVEDLKNSESSVIKIVSDVGFATKALYYSGPFVNTGAVSPKIEKETTYTIVWTLTNSANNISMGQVHTTIPSWMRFVGPISPSSEDLVYNPATREITWNFGSIPRGTGITGSNREVAFQLAFTPSLSQVGTSPVIINDASLTGHDDFANVDVRVTKSALRTRLDNDPLFPAGAGIVTE